jgi:hypothetical protein
MFGWGWASACKFPRPQGVRRRTVGARALHKTRPKKLLGGKGRDGLRYVDNLESDGASIFAHVCWNGLEGIMSSPNET